MVVRRRGIPQSEDGTTMADGAECESCGVDGEVLYAVHRMYVTPEAWDTPASSRTLDEVEHWCFACCSHYPHEPVET